MGVALLAGTACSGDEGSSAAPTTFASGPAGEIARARSALPAAVDQALPPQDLPSIRKVYDEALATMGLRLTRAALIDLEGGRYEPSPDGRHLALYVEPLDGRDAVGYSDDIWPLSALVTPDVFARWPGLDSYDICQEPLPELDDSPEPPPVTQLNITRTAADGIDWEQGGLVDLLVAARTEPSVRMFVNSQVRGTETYRTASDEARAIAPRSAATVPERTGGTFPFN